MSAVGSASQSWWQGPIYPATIKQLLRAERPHSRSNFSVDGIEIGVVTCVAGIVAISDHGSKKTCYLEDGSAGRLRTTWFQDLETSLQEQLETHTYVRVVGRLDTYNNLTELKAMHIRPVTDMHEPFFHFLEAMVTFTSKQRPSVPPSAHNATGAEESQSPLATQSILQDTDEPASSHGAHESTSHDASAAIVREFDELTLVSGTGNLSGEDPSELETPQISLRSLRQPSSPPPPMSGAGPLATGPSLRQDPYSALSLLQRDIILQIKNNDALYPDGVPIRVVFRRTVSPRSGVDESEIRQTIDNLMDKGLLYSTIDLHHFKLVD